MRNPAANLSKHQVLWSRDKGAEAGGRAQREALKEEVKIKNLAAETLRLTTPGGYSVTDVAAQLR